MPDENSPEKRRVLTANPALCYFDLTTLAAPAAANWLLFLLELLRLLRVFLHQLLRLLRVLLLQLLRFRFTSLLFRDLLMLFVLLLLEFLPFLGLLCD